MNLIDTIEGPRIRVELKYCERCGGLWLRRLSTDGVYCSGCRAHLAAKPELVEKSTRKACQRKPRRRAIEVNSDSPADGLQATTRIEYLQGVATIEVQA